MSQNVAEPASEVKRLQRCMSDLVSVLALPATWSKSEPSRILETSLDALVKLLELDFLYAQARAASHEELIEALRTVESDGVSNKRDEIRQALRPWFGEDRPDDLPAVRRRIAGREISILSLQLGIEGTLGLIVAGSQRPDFPQQTERLVMRVAANQVAIMLQQAQFVSEQRRIARELDQHVAQKTRELAAANEQLRNNEKELLRKEEFLTEAQRLSATGSFSWCVETGEITFSEGARRIFGFETDALVTFELIATRVHPEDLPLLAERTEAARRVSEGQDYEIRLLMPDGSIKYLHSTSNETRGFNGQREYIGAVQDVTQRRLAQESLNKARSELAHVSRVTSLSALTASMAHEINQPLSGIMTNANTCLRMLNANPPNVEGARETARRTIRDGNRASDVITRLRTLFSKKEVAVESVDLNEATREVFALLLSELQRNKAVLHYDFADRLPIVKGDRIQLQQVILNLARNASDALSGIEDRPKRLLIRTEQVGESVCLSVQDSGIGFDPGIADRLFESFYTTKPNGMGIGLSVSRSIIEAHGGRLWATANDGPGATFAFSIPCERSQ